MDARAAEAAIRARALSLPDAYEQERWGIPVFKLPGNSVFCFGSAGRSPATATVKLSPEEREVALSLPWARVARYVGRYGWITGEASDEAALDAICDWLVESYWMRASPPLREQLEASPLWAG